MMTLVALGPWENQLEFYTFCIWHTFSMYKHAFFILASWFCRTRVCGLVEVNVINTREWVHKYRTTVADITLLIKLISGTWNALFSLELLGNEQVTSIISF